MFLVAVFTTTAFLCHLIQPIEISSLQQDLFARHYRFDDTMLRNRYYIFNCVASALCLNSIYTRIVEFANLFN